MSKLTSLLVAATLAAAGSAAAETKLTTTPFTASAGGFFVTSTLISGDKDAILVDAQFTLAEAHRVVAMILESKKNLTTVFVTHGHPDHYFGLGAIKQAFPKVKIVALPGAVAEIKKTVKDKVKQWGALYGALVPTAPVQPTAHKGTSFTLEGQAIEIKGPTQGDSTDNTYLWIPSIKTVIAGDIVFAGVHPWTKETNSEQRKAWIKTLDDIAALQPTTVIAGHRDPKAKGDLAAVKQTKEYIQAFDAAVASAKSSAEVQLKMKQLYKDLQLEIILQLGADAQFPAAAPPAPAPAKK